MLELARATEPEDGPLRELLELLVHHCGLLEQRLKLTADRYNLLEQKLEQLTKAVKVDSDPFGPSRLDNVPWPNQSSARECDHPALETLPFASGK